MLASRMLATPLSCRARQEPSVQWSARLPKSRVCRVVGIAGGADKVKYILDIGFDAAMDYKQENLKDAMRKLCQMVWMSTLIMLAERLSIPSLEHQPRCANFHLRRYFAIQQYRRRKRSIELPCAAGEPGQHDRNVGKRLHGSLCRRWPRNGRLDGYGKLKSRETSCRVLQRFRKHC